MRKTGKFLVGFTLFFLVIAGQSWASGAAPGVSPDEALKMLKEGNARFASSAPRHPHQSQERRGQTATKGQQPFAAVLSCSDSRAPVEILFDQGIGDLFVVRVAGNVAAGDEMGSLEYAVDHLGTPLVLVLGHTQCGAVTAVVEGDKVHGHVGQLVRPIVPAVAKARKENPGLAGKTLIPAAIKANVLQALEDLLRKSKIVREKVRDGKVKLVGAIYDLETGKVEIMGPHPAQAGLLGANPPAPKSAK